MTYCIAWKVSNMVFLAADAATTSGRPFRADVSSFGETHRSVGKSNVEESALKIIRIGGTGATFAGDVVLGSTLVRLASRFVDEGLNAKDAVEKAVTNIRPIPKPQQLEVAFGGFSDGKAELYYVNCAADGVVLPIDGLVQFGSISKQHRKLTRDVLLRLIRPDAHLNARGLLMSVMACVQSYGVHHPLIDEHVGGAISGACIDEDGWHWHPDVAFVLYDSSDIQRTMHVVANVVRDDIACITSSFAKETRGFLHGWRSERAKSEWEQKWVDLVSLDPHLRTFEYVVFLDYHKWRGIIVEMLSNDSHRLLKWKVDEKEYAPGELAIHPRLASMLTEDMGDLRMMFRFLPYEPLHAC